MRVNIASILVAKSIWKPMNDFERMREKIMEKRSSDNIDSNLDFDNFITNTKYSMHKK